MSSEYRPYRLEIEGLLEPLAPFHIGTGERLSLVTDDPILRERADPSGTPYVPGTSLKGVLRSHLEREACLLGCDSAAVERLFGPRPARGASSADFWMGRLTVFDAYPTEGDCATEIRDHVRIHSGWGAADYGAKFDTEVASPGQMQYRFLVCYEGDGSREDLLLLREAVRFLEGGELRVGAKSGWGYGRMRLKNPVYREFDRSKDAGLAAYVAHRLGKSPPPIASFRWPEWMNPRPAGELKPFCELSMCLKLEFEGPVLVKSAYPPEPTDQQPDPNDVSRYGEAGAYSADHVFVTSVNGHYYLPGASLRGVLRHRTEKIVKTLGLRPLDAELFGYARRGIGEGRKGRLEVMDGALEGKADLLYLDHVAIDRITHAAADAKKFSTCALASPKFSVELCLRFTQDELNLVALFAFLLRDMMEGWLWIGSGTTRGYGSLRRATCEHFTLNLVEGTPLQVEAPVTQQPCQRPGRSLYAAKGIARFEDLQALWRQLDSHWRKELGESNDEGNRCQQ